jgi:hypothetical protein
VEIVRRVFEGAARRDDAMVLALYDHAVELISAATRCRRVWGKASIGDMRAFAPCSAISVALRRPAQRSGYRRVSLASV